MKKGHYGKISEPLTKDEESERQRIMQMREDGVLVPLGFGTCLLCVHFRKKMNFLTGKKYLGCDKSKEFEEVMPYMCNSYKKEDKK